MDNVLAHPFSASANVRASAPVRLPVTAFVITFNEARRLRDCLRSLEFCDQVVVVDLGSADESPGIAREMGAEVHFHERMPIADMILPRVAHLARHVWRMRFDPDEVFDPGLLPDVARLLGDPRAGVILLPYLYHFKSRPLFATVWGGVRHLRVFFHAERADLRPVVHNGIVCLPGFETVRADAAGEHPIKHYWIDDWGQMWEKHRRYLGREGESRHRLGQRFAWSTMAREVAAALKAGLWRHSGWRAGLDGWALSFFYAGYVAAAQLALRSYQRALARGVVS